MCGITAFLTLQRDPDQCAKPPDKLEAILDSSLDSIKHRGPDARGQWISTDRRVGE